MALGRPSSFTQEAADIICEQIATTTKSLRKICNGDNRLPEVSSVLRWLRTNEDFRIQYARAKEEQADMMADDMLDIADDSSNDTIMGDKGPIENREWVNRSRLKIDTRKWLAAKLKPKKYGEKLDLTSDNRPLGGVTPQQFDQLLAAANQNSSK